MSKEALLQEQQALERAVADFESRIGPVEPDICALKERLRDIEALLSGEGPSANSGTDWVELCHLCGRRCWL